MRIHIVFTIVILLAFRGLSFACDSAPEDYEYNGSIFHVTGIYKTFNEAWGAYAEYSLENPGYDAQYYDLQFDDCWNGFFLEYGSQNLFQCFVYPSDGESPPMMKEEYYQLMMGLAGVIFGCLLWVAIIENA